MSNAQIRKARERRGHTVTEAAAAIGVSSRTWHRWELGDSEPQSPIIARALEAYIRKANKGD